MNDKPYFTYTVSIRDIQPNYFWSLKTNATQIPLQSQLAALDNIDRIVDEMTDFRQANEQLKKFAR